MWAMQTAEMKQTIVAMARTHGFDLCHFTRPAFPDKHREGLDHWIAASMQGQMDYMAEEGRCIRRKQPEVLVEGVKAVISVAMRHSPPAYKLDQSINARNNGVIAAYAHGDDYHDVVKKRLRALAADLDELLGKHDQRVFTDTAPILEHALAEEGGLGWQGKHTLTIHRKLGSWMMLGEIFTTAEITPDDPASFHCGTCNACIDICPTKAIVEPFVVDARRCISYLTIEYNGFIERELRPLMGNRIFGCDDCQAICPWNRHASAPEPDLLIPRKENSLPDLSELFSLDDEAFKSRFRKSPVKRSKRAGLLRNVAIAMGNSSNPDFVPALIESLNDHEPLIRGHAVWALEQLYPHKREGDIQEALSYLSATETDPNVLEEIELTLRKLKESES